MKIDFTDPEALTCNTPFFKKNEGYQPIDCGHYDYLEIWAMRRTPLRISYKLDDDTSVIVHSYIKDVSTQDGVEYLYTEPNSKIRLDRLIWIETQK